MSTRQQRSRSRSPLVIIAIAAVVLVAAVSAVAVVMNQSTLPKGFGKIEGIRAAKGPIRGFSAGPGIGSHITSPAPKPTPAPGRVELLDYPGGTPVATTTAGKDGHFTFVVKAGYYGLSGGPGTQCSPDSIQVVRGRTAKVELDCIPSS